MMQKKQISAVPVYAFGVCFVLCAFLSPIYEPFFFIISFFISALAYFVFSKIAPYKIIEVEAAVSVTDTGDERLNALITQGRTELREIDILKRKIKNDGLVKSINELEYYGKKIFDHIEANPKDASSVRQFMDYYLPTSLKLIDNYVSLSQGGSGENISKATEKIDGSFETIAAAFKKQYDNLFEDDAIDIVAEVNVMEKLLKAEGLLDSRISDIKKGGGN